MLKWFQGLLSENIAFWFFPWVILHLIVHEPWFIFVISSEIENQLAFSWSWVWYFFFGPNIGNGCKLGILPFCEFSACAKKCCPVFKSPKAQKWYPSHSREWGTPPFKKLIMNFELNSLKGNDYFLRRSQSTILSCIDWLSIDSMVQKTYDFTDLSGDWRWSITILSLSTTSSTILPETSISWITVLSFILILS